MPTASARWQTAETPSRGYAYEFPQTTHGVLDSSPCAQAIIFEFVQNPQEPQNPCLDRLPEIDFKAP